MTSNSMACSLLLVGIFVALRGLGGYEGYVVSRRIRSRVDLRSFASGSSSLCPRCAPSTGSVLALNNVQRTASVAIIRRSYIPFGWAQDSLRASDLAVY